MKTNKYYYLDSGKVVEIQDLDVMIYSIDDAVEYNKKIFFSAYNGGNGMFAKYYLLALDMATMQLKFIDICDNVEFIKNKKLIKATKDVLVREGSCAAENEYDFRDYYFNVEEIASNL